MISFDVSVLLAVAASSTCERVYSSPFSETLMKAFDRRLVVGEEIRVDDDPVRIALHADVAEDHGTVSRPWEFILTVTYSVA